MPMISDQDFAAFQQWKSGGGQPGGPFGQPGSGASVDADSLRSASDRYSGLPAGVDIGGGNMDYTAQNAEITRRSLAAQNDPNSPTYIPPETRAKIDAANARQGAANPGWTYHASANYWTPDDAHNNAAGRAAFAGSWEAMGKADPVAGDVPTDAQGRAIDARTGQAMPGATTAAQRAQPQGAPQWQPPPGAPPQPTAGGEQGYGRGYSPTGTMQQTGATPPAQAPAAPSPTPGQQPPTQAAAWKPGAPLPVWDPQKGYQTPSSGRSPGGTY
jgi:hypothetical protein